MGDELRGRLVDAATELLVYLALSDEPEPADIIWGLGSHESRVAERAAALYLGRWAPLIVFSGGRGHRWAHLTASEAEIFRDTALSLGVPAEDILVETSSTNTAENIHRSSELFAERFLEVRSALLVTIPPFQRRAWCTALTHRPDIRCINCPGDWGSPESWADDQLRLVVRLCVGEIQRLQDYPKRGFLRSDLPPVPSHLVDLAASLAPGVSAW
jgi:hypothetical protein